MIAPADYNLTQDTDLITTKSTVTTQGIIYFSLKSLLFFSAEGSCNNREFCKEQRCKKKKKSDSLLY